MASTTAVMASAVWIAHVPGVVLRKNVAFARWGDLDNPDPPKRLWVGLGDDSQQWPPWLLARMKDIDVEMPTRPKTSKPDLRIIGIAQLTPRGIETHQGPLTNWDAEGKLLLQMHHNPLDSCKVKVLDAAMLREPIYVKMSQRARADGRSSARVEAKITAIGKGFRSNIFKPVLPPDVDFVLEDGLSIKQKMTAWKVAGGLSLKF